MLTDDAGNQAGGTGRALTHGDCLARLPGAALGRGAGLPWVQLKRYHPAGAYVLCGQVVELANDSETGAELFKVQTCLGPMWSRGKALRMCSGDGRCTCEPAPGQPAGATCCAPIDDGRSTAWAPIRINRPAPGAARGFADV